MPDQSHGMWRYRTGGAECLSQASHLECLVFCKQPYGCVCASCSVWIKVLRDQGTPDSVGLGVKEPPQTLSAVVSVCASMQRQVSGT